MMPVGHVGDTHRRISGVDVLATRTRSAIGINLQVAFNHLNVDVVVDHRVGPGRAERGVAAGIRIVRRNAHQAMHAAFRLQLAIGIVALDLQRAGLDAGFFAGVLVQHFDLVLVLVGPAHIHAHQHGSPVLAFRTARTCVDLQVAVVGVGFSREQRVELHAWPLLP